MPDPNKDKLYETPGVSERDTTIGWQIAACIIALVVLVVLTQ